jgi:hypothetical protein
VLDDVAAYLTIAPLAAALALAALAIAMAARSLRSEEGRAGVGARANRPPSRGKEVG